MWSDEYDMMGVLLTPLFADSFLCVVERWCGVLLGIQRKRPSDTCCCFCILSRGLFCVVGGDIFCGQRSVIFVQVGDGSTTQRNTPVGVSGLGSGVAMIALGGVSLGLYCICAV